MVMKRGIGPSTPPSPKRPTNQMTSILEVILPGGGGTDKVTYLLSLHFLPLSCQPTLSSLPISTSMYEASTVYLMLSKYELPVLSHSSKHGSQAPVGQWRWQ